MGSRTGLSEVEDASTHKRRKGLIPLGSAQVVVEEVYHLLPMLQLVDEVEHVVNEVLSLVWLLVGIPLQSHELDPIGNLHHRA